MRWFSLIKYLSQALSDWWQEWKPVLEEEKRKAEEANQRAQRVVDVKPENITYE